jgi:hypothetical protein
VTLSLYWLHAVALPPSAISAGYVLSSISLSYSFFAYVAGRACAAQGLPPVSTTPVANGKNLQAEKF